MIGFYRLGGGPAGVGLGEVGLAVAGGHHGVEFAELARPGEVIGVNRGVQHRGHPVGELLRPPHAVQGAVAVGIQERHGFINEAQRVAYGLFEAADHFGGRLPELISGLSQDRYPLPGPYPAACSPQAWAAAAPIHLIRTLMRFDPALPWNELWPAPELPKGFGHFRIHNVPFAGNAKLSINITTESVTLDGLPESIKLRLEARPALLELLNLTRMK